MITINGEGTRDPIFTLQRRQFRVLVDPLGWEWDCDGEGYVPDEDLEGTELYPTVDNSPDADFDEERLFLSYEAAFERGGDGCIEWWETERIFLTREEGTAWAKAREYNYSSGWRIYCMCAEGELTGVLNNVRETK